MAELSAKEQLEAMINGTHEDTIVEDGVNEEIEDSEEEVEVEAEETTDTEEEIETEDTEESEEDNEDTDQDTEDSEEDETKDEADESDEDTSETEDEDQEEDSHDEPEDSKEDSENTDNIDYKEFYEKVALAKFTANGKEVEGFKNPEDLIRAQQMLHGYSDKMKVFKEYKQFLKPLEERGVTKDPEKFSLAMSLLDGDVDAIKKVLKDKEIDPMELDLEELNYVPKNVLPTPTEMVLEETFEQAKTLGVEDKFNQVIGNDWDVNSLKELIGNSKVRGDLLRHLSDGTYDTVQTEIKRMELLDTTGSLDGMTDIDKYRFAIQNLRKNAPAPKQEPAEPVENAEEKARKAEEFKIKAAEKAKKEAEIAEQRKRAASVSKKKAVKKPAPKPRLEELKGDAFRDEFKKMLMS